MYEHRAPAGAPGLVGVQLVPTSHVREEIPLPQKPPVPLAPHTRHRFGFRVEVLPAGPGDSGRDGCCIVGIVEEKLRVWDGGHGEGQIVVVEQPDRLLPVGIAELVVAIPGQQEQGVLLPFHGFPSGFARAPHGGQPPALQDVHNLINRKLERGQGLARGNLADPCFDNALLAQKLHEGGMTTPVFPPSQLHGSQVRNEIAGVDGHIGRAHPLVISVCGNAEIGRSFLLSLVGAYGGFNGGVCHNNAP